MLVGNVFVCFNHIKIGYPRIPWSDTLESLLCPFTHSVSFFLEKKLLHFNCQFTLSQSFQHDLSPAVKILAKSSPIPVLDYNWPPPDLAAVSMSSSKEKSSVIDNMVHALGFSRFPSFPSFIIWKSYFPLRTSGQSAIRFAVRFQALEVMSPRRMYTSAITFSPNYLKMLMFSIYLKTGLLQFPQSINKGDTAGRVMGNAESFSHFLPLVYVFSWQTLCEVWKEVRLIGGLLECCMLIP